jgi:hypothetical protein
MTSALVIFTPLPPTATALDRIATHYLEQRFQSVTLYLDTNPLQIVSTHILCRPITIFRKETFDDAITRACQTRFPALLTKAVQRPPHDYQLTCVDLSRKVLGLTALVATPRQLFNALVIDGARIINAEETEDLQRAYARP